MEPKQKENFWLECFMRASKPKDDRMIYVEKLDRMTQEDFVKIVNAHPNRYSSSGLYRLWGDEQKIVQKFSKNKIDCNKYEYNIVTMHFVEILKATKAAEDRIEIEWFNRITGKIEGDNRLIGEELMVGANTENLCELLKLSPKDYPFDGIAYIVEEKDVAKIQKFIQHKLDLNKYQYFITNAAKGLNCAEWDKWLPI